MSSARTESKWIRWTLIGVALSYMSFFLFLPLIMVFISGLNKGLAFYLKCMVDPNALAAMKLTLITALIAVPLNVVFGIAASWAIAKFDFRGKNILLTLIDLPLSVSPVVSGLIYILLFGAQGAMGPWLRDHDIKIIFAAPAIILATMFVTFPMVARELIPLMKAQGNDEEEAAMTLGASGFKAFWHVTLPNIKWGLLYGVILCNARAMGEFGAVSVVSGHIRGQTNTLPLHIEILYNEYNFTAAFAVSSLLAMLALLTLVAKTMVEFKFRAELNAVREKEAIDMSIEVKNICKTFGSFKALDNVSLNVETGELIALLGPSGSGKTTLLRIIAGLETPDSGQVLFHGQDAVMKKTKDRNVGFVFQHYALFRHMTVADNIAFGLRVQPRHIRPSEDKIKAKVKELLGLVQLDWVGDRYPSQLSGGQRQRIALARALAIEPKVLLLDEPFGSLDAQVRKELRQWLRRFHDDLHITTLFVTHDQEEALEVSDRIVVMNKGHIEQVGTPEEVYHKPASVFVLNFLGNVNLFHGRVVDGKLYVGQDAPAGQEAKNANLYVRPHQFDVNRTRQAQNAIRAVIKYINPAGSSVKLDLASDAGHLIQVELTQQEFTALKLIKGEEVYVCPKDVTFCEYDI